MPNNEIVQRLSLKEISKLTGYAPDYVGWLIRHKKIKGRQESSGAVWRVDTGDLLQHYKKTKNLDIRDSSFLKRRYLTLKEASILTGYSADYVGQLIRLGKVKGEKISIGKSWVTDVANIKNYKTIQRNKRDYLKLPLLAFHITKFSFVYRDKNFLADSLVNQTLDEHNSA